jgi:hypothetical protein
MSMEQQQQKDVKHVYVRERQTDDVFRFWIAATAEEIQANERATQKEYVPESKRNDRKLFASSATFALLLVATVFAAGITTTHQTLSYFNDVEASNANSLTAGILDLEIDGVDFGGEVTEGETGVTIEPALSGAPGSFNLEYRVRAEKIDGTEPFCSLIHAHTEGAFTYDGPLVSFTGGPSLSVGINTFQLSLPDATGVLNGNTCQIDLIYTAWAKDATDEQGYIDEERVHITLTATGLPEQAPALFNAFNLFGDDAPEETDTDDEQESEVDAEDDTTPEDEKRAKSDRERESRGERGERTESGDESSERSSDNSGAVVEKDKDAEKEDMKDDKNDSPSAVEPPTENVSPTSETPVSDQTTESTPSIETVEPEQQPAPEPPAPNPTE